MWAEWSGEELPGLGPASVSETSSGLDEGTVISKLPGQLQKVAQGRALIPARRLSDESIQIQSVPLSPSRRLPRIATPMLDQTTYRYAGEAVVGKRLKEAQLGATFGMKLASLPEASVQIGYAYSFVESPLDEVSIDRSNGFVDLGYSVNRRLYVHGTGIWQRTHGGLRAGSATGRPFLFPGELNTPERYAQRDRLIRTHYWQLGGGLTYGLGPVDAFVSYANYIWGRDAHNGQVFGAGVTWYFGFPE